MPGVSLHRQPYPHVLNVIIVIGMAPFSTHILLYICVLQASERTVKMAIAESFRMMVEGDFGFVALVS